MKKVSKNLGITRPCPECKKTLIKEINFDGGGSQKIKCAYCGSTFSITFTQKMSVTIKKVIDSIKENLVICLIALIATAAGVFFLLKTSQVIATLFQ